MQAVYQSFQLNCLRENQDSVYDYVAARQKPCPIIRGTQKNPAPYVEVTSRRELQDDADVTVTSQPTMASNLVLVDDHKAVNWHRHYRNSQPLNRGAAQWRRK